MSSNIWMQCAGDSRKQSLALTAWRVVEAQHQLSTRKLVNSAEEQIMLEELIDSAKPPSIVSHQLHYLLSTAFRYPPLRHGTRFGSRYEMGIWYGAEQLKTALAEVAYYRFVLVQGTTANLGMLTTPLSAFNVSVRSSAAIDLTAAPFAKYQDEISSAVQYVSSQALGTAMRRANVDVCRYVSARALELGNNVAVFSPDAFRRARPRGFETWHLVSTDHVVEFSRHDYFERVQHRFELADFLVDGVLPSPAF